MCTLRNVAICPSTTQHKKENFSSNPAATASSWLRWHHPQHLLSLPAVHDELGEWHKRRERQSPKSEPKSSSQLKLFGFPGSEALSKWNFSAKWEVRNRAKWLCNTKGILKIRKIQAQHCQRSVSWLWWIQEGFRQVYPRASCCIFARSGVAVHLLQSN